MMYLKLIFAFTTALVCQVSWAERIEETTCNCEWTNKGRIIGGSETTTHEFPWIAALYRTNFNDTLCGASVITAYHALTAGHCVEMPDPSLVVLVVGVHNVQDPRDGTRIPIEKLIQHPDFNTRARTSDDIAVIVTRTDGPMGPNVGPVCLPSARIELDIKKIKALGWVQPDFTHLDSPVLRSVDLTVVSYEYCKLSQKIVEPKAQICTEDDGKSICFGDSGSPLVLLDPEIKRYTLVALTSYGNQCVTPPPAVNTEVAVYMAWVRKVIQENKPAKICTKVSKRLK